MTSGFSAPFVPFPLIQRRNVKGTSAMARVVLSNMHVYAPCFHAVLNYTMNIMKNLVSHSLKGISFLLENQSLSVCHTRCLIV